MTRQPGNTTQTSYYEHERQISLYFSSGQSFDHMKWQTFNPIQAGVFWYHIGFHQTVSAQQGKNLWGHK